MHCVIICSVTSITHTGANFNASCCKTKTDMQKHPISHTGRARVSKISYSMAAVARNRLSSSDGTQHGMA